MSNSVNAHGGSTEASPRSRAPADQGAGRGREQGEDLSSGHPIHPPSSTSTREPATMDGWPTTATAKAMLRQLDADRERSGYWRSRWAEDHSDQAIEAWLRSLLDWLETAGPVDEIRRLRDAATPGPEFVDHLVSLAAGSRSAIGGRPVEEIRADLARRRELAARPGHSPELDDVDDRLALDVEPLLAEVEAAHRFERSVAVEVAELVESLERVTEQRDAFRDERNIAVNAAASKIPGFDVETIAVHVRQREAADRRARDLLAEVRSLRGVVQAVEALRDEMRGAFGASNVSCREIADRLAAALAATREG